MAERVLVACGRHCSLCHKYCGLKIELHHIKQQSLGGPDTFENCIPLCFDCHADMRSYDHKHPKGRKFTESELIKHRDAWYEKYARGGGATALPEYKSLDERLFQRILQRLPYNPLMANLRNRYAGQPYRRGAMDRFADYLDDCHDPTFEFLDSDLEAARGGLTAAVNDYNNAVLNSAFVDDSGNELVIQPGMKYANPDAYYKIVHDLSRKEVALLEAYDSLVKLGRRKLGIDAPVV